MIRVILIRPGTTDYDQQRRIKGTLDMPLNQFGNDQIVRVANELAGQKIDQVYASPCQAAGETAQLLSGTLGVKFKTVQKLRNLDHGLWQGKLIDDIKSTQRKVYKRWQAQPNAVCPPEGETIQEVRERISSSLERILKKHKSGVIAMVVPEPLASIVRAYLERGAIGDLWRAETECGSWNAIEVHADQTLASG